MKPVLGEAVLLERPAIGRVAPCATVSVPAMDPTSDAKMAEFPMTSVQISTGRQILRDLVELTKPRIVVMILITTWVSAVVAAGGLLDLSLGFYLMMGTALVAASAGILNQYLERTIDLRMIRTARRPIPAGRFNPAIALVYGLVTVIVGTVILAEMVSGLTALFGLATWIAYLAIYTPLKQVTSFNTTVGAIAGALPTMMGFTGGGGTLSDPAGWLLLGILVAWQYPHFMAIAWLYRREYGDAGFKMTTVVDPSGTSAGRQSVIGALALPCLLGGLVFDSALWPVWMIAGCLLSWSLIRAAWLFAKEPSETTARRMLWASLSQLPLAMLLLVVVTLWGR